MYYVYLENVIHLEKYVLCLFGKCLIHLEKYVLCLFVKCYTFREICFLFICKMSIHLEKYVLCLFGKRLYI